jgi:hypothetical protein
MTAYLGTKLAPIIVDRKAQSLSFIYLDHSFEEFHPRLISQG